MRTSVQNNLHDNEEIEMTKATKTEKKSERTMEVMLLAAYKDRYKLAYATIRWAKEIKKTENLPDPVPTLVPRALREIMDGKTTIKQVEKLPMAVKMSTTPPVIPVAAGAPVPVSTPTLSLNPSKLEANNEPKKETKEEKK